MVNSKIGTGQGLCNTVCKVISDFGLDVNKCIGSSTDGASNMRGEYNGFNAWLSKEAPQQVHVWCYAHILNLIMTDTTKVCIESISLFGLLNSCAVFVRESYVRMAKWEEKSKYRFISVIGETRWWSKDKCLSKMFGIFDNPESSLYVNVIDTFHDIYTSDKFSIEIRHKSKCYLDSLLQYKTIATAHIFLRIFISTTPLSLYLQTKGMNFIQAFSMVKETIQTLQSQRRNLEPVLEATNNFINWANNEFHERKLNYKIEKYTKVGRQSKIKKKRNFDEVTEDEAIYDQNERFKIDVFNVIYDQILTSLIDRFEKHEDLFREISYFDPNSFELIKNLKYHDLDFLGKRLQKYDPQFNPGDLLAELLDFSSKWDSIKRLADNLHNSVSYEDSSEIMPNQILSDHDSPLESACKDCIICCFKVLHQYQLHMSAYKNLYLAYKYILSLSCTQVSCERTFSKLKYILNRLRCMMSQEKLEHFLLMSVEKDILCNVKNDDVIDLIAQKSNLLKQILTVQ